MTDDPALRAARTWLIARFGDSATTAELETLTTAIRTELAEALEAEARLVWCLEHDLPHFAERYDDEGEVESTFWWHPDNPILECETPTIAIDAARDAGEDGDG